MSIEGVNVTDNDILEPYGVTDTPLILVISTSPVYRETIKAYLLDFDYRVAGPFENVDQAHSFLRRTEPDLIFFDAMTTQSELISYSTLLRDELESTPTLVLHNADGFSISHTIIDFIFPPINPNKLKQKIRGLLNPNLEDTDPTEEFLSFVNDTFSTIIDLAPDYAVVDIKTILTEEINTLAVRNSEITSKSEELIQIQLKKNNQVKPMDLASSVEVLLMEVIDRINITLEAEWGQSLIEDALETVTIKYKVLPKAAIRITERIGKGYSQIIKKYKYAVPDLENLDKSILVAKLLLTDYGPELADKISSNPSFGNEFNENIASQLITLVGQGSNYHEGIYGPVPIPGTEDIIAIIWSKLIDSDIRDERMSGKTLVIVSIGFRKILLNSIPGREDLQYIFEELEDYRHESQIDRLCLQTIAEKFHGQLH